MEGRNSEIDIRWAEADVELMKRFLSRPVDHSNQRSQIA